MANAAIVCKEEAEHGVVRTTTRRLEEQYRSTIEELQDQLKTLKGSYGNVTVELQSKD